MRKLGILDDRWNFNRGAFGGFINGSAAEPIERRFYGPCDLNDSLPWSFYGELATRDGALLKRMLSTDRGRCNILFYGDPGTGKTSFAKTLAKEVRRQAFEVRQAEEEGAILFFDEIDGLVRDREGASQSWQVAQVNELLQQMENFGGIMVAATNFSTSLDPATMRRLTYKLEFGYLEETGKRLFFERMFKMKLSDEEFAELNQLENLTPGDFRTVHQELFYLGGTRTNLERIAALKAECEMKKDGKTRPKIGFAA